MFVLDISTYQIYELIDLGFIICFFMWLNYPMIRYWLFEPRSGFHDIGGWYIETYGKDNKGKNVPSQRYWDGIDLTEPYER